MQTTASPVAPATAAIFQKEPMADIIDSLKRLERVGDDASKTTRKLLDAARAVEALICKAYGVGSDEDDVIEIPNTKYCVRYSRPDYYDEDGNLRLGKREQDVKLPTGGLYRYDRRVSESRNAAQDFSESLVRDNLLDLITADLERRAISLAESTTRLEEAAQTIKSTASGQTSRASIFPPANALDAFKNKNKS